MVLTTKEIEVACVLVAALTVTAFAAGWSCRRPSITETTVATQRTATAATSAYVGVSSSTETTIKQIEYRTTTEWLKDGTIKQVREAQKDTVTQSAAAAAVHETESRTAVSTSEIRTVREPVTARPTWLRGASVRADAD